MSKAIAPPLALGAEPLTLQRLVDVARGGARVELAAVAAEHMRDARAVVDAIVGGGEAAPAVYGVNTGFGALAEIRISSEEILALQQNLVRSHSAGVGEPLPRDATRAMLLLRAAVLSRGHSGARVELCQFLCNMLNCNVHPLIPSRGSVGASGDLAPLAHLALAAIGEGKAELGGEWMPAADALRAVGLEPIELAAKEGLTLLNGTQHMTAVGGLALWDASLTSDAADIAAAMSLEALQGTVRAFDARVVGARDQPGQKEVAATLRRLLAHSEIAASHRDCGKVQDPYSLRCVPQVHGASRDVQGFARQVLEAEANSSTDNPLVFVDPAHPFGGEILSGGNFHGQPVAHALDMAAIAIAELANISERRLEQLVNPALSSGLPPFLAPEPGLNSGFMIAQVAAASLVSENKILCHPASVDSIPSSAGREDHVSMGATAALKLASVHDHVRTVIAIELLAAAQGLSLRLPHRPRPRPPARLRTHPPGGARYVSRSPSLRRHQCRPRPLGRRTAGRRRSRGHFVSRMVRSPRGKELRCKGWPQEAALRMLMNNLDPEVAERPEDLVVYGGTGRAARSWDDYDAIVAELERLENDHTLLIQSGRPVGVFRTHEDAPRVLLANSNLVGRWATWEHFGELERAGLMMYGQMTAGSWIYIGTQGILQGTYETFIAAAKTHFGAPNLRGRWVVTAGLGGMGGAQPLAVTMAGGVCVCVEVDRSPRRAARRARLLG